MLDSKLLDLLNSIVGEEPLMQGGTQAQYHCPFCNHPKKKLSINLDKSSDTYCSFKCWVCSHSGRSLYKLFKCLNVTSDKVNSYRILTKSKSYKLNYDSELHNDEFAAPFLPEDFISIQTVSNSLWYKMAKNYLTSRGITDVDICRYNIGYCADGFYKNRIIIPSYNSNNELNFFIARSFDGNTLRYKNPQNSKNIIFFENLINWDYDVVLVEGVFDAISIRSNCIPLLGTVLCEQLKSKLSTKKNGSVKLFLDKDAKPKYYKILDELRMCGLPIYLIESPKKDASELGFEESYKLLNYKQSFVTESDLLKIKLLNGSYK